MFSYRRQVATCWVLTGICPLLAAAPLPDPAECFLQPISIELDGGFPAQEASISTLSGDGQTLLQYCRSLWDIFNSVSITQREYLIRDGARTVLTDFYASNVMGGPYTYSGPAWRCISLPFDGAFALAAKSVDGKAGAVLLSLPDKLETPLPLTWPMQVSGNGAWAVGRFDQAGKTSLRRVRLSDQSFIEIVLPGDVVGPEVAAFSDAGDACFGRALQASTGTRRQYHWTAETGFRWLPAPEGFEATDMDGSGKIFVGTYWRASHPEIPQLPALWSAVEGLKTLPIQVPGVAATFGSGWKISGDGRLIFGFVSNDVFSGADVVWTRDGAVFVLKDLIRGVDFAGLQLGRPSAVSRDGKTIAGTAYTSDFQTKHYLARLALPGEGPKVSLSMDSAGKRTATFRAKNGFRYQTQAAITLGQWTPVGEPITGNDVTHSVELPDSAAATGFVRVVVEAQ